MKVCPQCNAHYEDSMFFCLEDGSSLKSADDSVQSNPATFEQTLILPTEEKTENLSTQNELTGEKTLNLPSEMPTQQKSVATNVWQPNPTVNEKPVPGSFEQSTQSDGKGKFIIGGVVLGGLALFGTALGGWWFLQKSEDEVAVANVNKQPQSISNSLGISSNNLSGEFGGDNSNVSNNLSTSSNTVVSTNSNKTTPKTTPTKDSKNSPTPTPKAATVEDSVPVSTPTPAVKTPTPAPTPKPTPEETSPPPPKTVSGGVVNGKATNLVKPPYPPAAKAVRASGAVSVQVTIDENGNVISASAVSGHALLRAAAEAAARASKFSPTVLAGQRVKVTGVIVYTFTAQ